jgi:glycosyltransferase involved in cell wall biosynthesis
LYKIIVSKAINKASYIVTPSNFTKEDILKEFKVSPNKIIVTLEGGPSEDILNKKEDKNISKKINFSKDFLLYVGNAYPHKNLDILLKVVSKIPKEINFVLAGKKDHFHDELEDSVKKMKLEKRIIFTDFVTDNELIWLYKNARAYIFPSLNEGFGLPLLEAASFGLPVLCSNNSSLPEVMEDSALYFNPKSSKDIVKKINIIIENKDIREELIVKGYNRVKKFSWNKMAKETLNIYKM